MAKDTKTKKSTETESEKEKLVRFNVDMPTKVHQDMKIRCAQSGESMKEYVLELIKKDLYS